MKLLLLSIVGVFALVYSSSGQQPTPAPRSPRASNSTEADNTKNNSTEQNKNSDTAEKQSNSKDDLALTQKIRQEVVNDKSLSMNAKNIKIVVRGGKVMLRGPVENEQEKNAIGAKAAQIAGKDKVDNQLDVKSGENK